MSKSYSIYRIYSTGKPPRLIAKGLSFANAHKWANSPLTQKEGVWFDAYTEDRESFSYSRKKQGSFKK